MEFLQPLLDQAFERWPAREANARIQAVRERLAGELGIADARNYEVVVPAAAAREWFAQSMLPRLVYHLASLGASIPGASRFFLSVFAGDTLYFLRAEEVFAFASTELGLSAEQMLERWGLAESSEPEPRPAPLMLPGPGRPH